MGVHTLGRGNAGAKRECEGGGICCPEGERRGFRTLWMRHNHIAQVLLAE